jgi:hypothetical protein
LFTLFNNPDPIVQTHSLAGEPLADGEDSLLAAAVGHLCVSPDQVSHHYQRSICQILPNGFQSESFVNFGTVIDRLCYPIKMDEGSPSRGNA